MRLIMARKAGSLTRAQEAALDSLAQASGASQPDVARAGAGQTAQQKLVDEIIKLGHMPIRAKTASAEEKKLAQRLWHARRVGSLTKEQEAALDKLPQARKTKGVEKAKKKAAKMETVVQQARDLGCYPKENAGRSLAERQLAGKLRKAFQQEPRDARAQDGDAGTGILRRPAARNAEEDRRVSRRIDAA